MKRTLSVIFCSSLFLFSCAKASDPAVEEQIQRNRRADLVNYYCSGEVISNGYTGNFSTLDIAAMLYWSNQASCSPSTAYQRAQEFIAEMASHHR